MSSQKRPYELKARAERQRDTRRRIVQATVELHQEVGPANTTVADIARRAGVQRLTVYNHFPQEAELFKACQQRFLGERPAPDFAPALALCDPLARLQGVLEALYKSYRDREPMTAKVLRDRHLLPALDQLMASTMDAQLTQLTDLLVAGLRARGQQRRRLVTVLGLALDFFTWQRLKDEGFGDRDAAVLMTDLVGAAAAVSKGR